jgi:hypothetical protein
MQERMNKISKIIDEYYNKFVAYARMGLFKGSSSIYGHTPEDIIHEGIIIVLTSIERTPELVLDVPDEELPFYIVGAVRKSSALLLARIMRSNSIRSGHDSTVFEVSSNHMSSSASGMKEFEKSERREVLDQMDSSLVCIVRQLEDDVPYNTIAKRFGMDETNPYRRLKKIKGNIKQEYKKHAE